MSLEDKENKIDQYIDQQITNKVGGNWELRRIKWKENQAAMLANPPITIEDIDNERDITDFLDNKQERINPQTYYLLQVIKELKMRIEKLETK